MAKEKSPLDESLDNLLKGKSPKEILGQDGLLDQLTKRLVERALEGEMTAHLGYEKHASTGRNRKNSRNGHVAKRVKTDSSEVEIEVPRDCEGTFEPQLVLKRRRRLAGFVDKVLSLYARGMSTREIQGHLKELLGIWIGESEGEGARFWLSVLTELKNRGVEDFLIAAVDGLKGFPDAIAAVYPRSQVQLCIVHMVRNSLRYVSWKHRKAVARDLRKIYTAPTAQAAEQELEAFSEAWDEVTPLISRQWRTHWPNLIPFFDYPPAIRRVIYTTNAIESIQAQLRNVTKKRGAFPSEASLLKVLYLALLKAQERWTMPFREWPSALYHFSLAFPGRVPL